MFNADQAALGEPVAGPEFIDACNYGHIIVQPFNTISFVGI